MKTFFRNNDSDELILLFCGWGMDEKPFQPLNSSADILFFYDYSDLEFDFNFSKYKKTTLITFSYGVFVAAMLKDFLPKCDVKIAVNGTLKPVDDEFGIPHKIFTLTLENMTELTALKFREKLFSEKSELSIFNKNLPNRDMQSSKDELAALKTYFSENPDLSFAYDKVIIGENDRIIPTKNQKNFWENNICHKNIHNMGGGHFLFYKFGSFDEIVEYDSRSEVRSMTQPCVVLEDET